jgi:hypothetical protein
MRTRRSETSLIKVDALNLSFFPSC